MIYLKNNLQFSMLERKGSAPPPPPKKKRIQLCQFSRRARERTSSVNSFALFFFSENRKDQKKKEKEKPKRTPDDQSFQQST